LRLVKKRPTTLENHARHVDAYRVHHIIPTITKGPNTLYQMYLKHATICIVENFILIVFLQILDLDVL